MNRMKKRYFGHITKTVCLVLVAVLLLAALPVSAEIYDSAIPKATETPAAPEGYRNVVVAIRDIASGSRIGENYLKAVPVKDINIPENAVDDPVDIMGMYVTEDIHEGEYVYEDMLSAVFKAPINSDLLVAPLSTAEDYSVVTVTDYVIPNTGEDLAGPLQQLINKNPGRTLYFPDGEYIISYPLCTSGVINNGTSFVLSDGAVIKAADQWRGIKLRNGLICMGSSLVSSGTGSMISGGTLDGNGKADGIIIESCVDSYVQNVDIVNTRIGIDIRDGADGGESRWTFRNVNIIGTGMVGSVGMKLEGEANTFDNILIYNMHTGVGMLGGNNVFSNVTIDNRENDDLYYSTSAGFVDTYSNIYTGCKVFNCTTAYQITAKSLITDCAAIWTNDGCKQQTAIKMSGGLTAITSFTAQFYGEEANAIFLDGSGSSKQKVISGCRMNEELADDKRYTRYLATDIIPIRTWSE